MTIEHKAEEINKKAEKHCNEVLCNAHEKCNEVIKCRDWRARRAGFFCGYEQAVKDLQKENYIQEQIIIGDQIEHNEEVSRLKQEVKNLRDNYELYKAAAEPTIKELKEHNEVLKRRIVRAKECMKKLLFIINSEPSNYNCKGLTQDAEDFIYDRICPIRKQGQHCITEEPCIMCDRS